jgi:hypothetical protein
MRFWGVLALSAAGVCGSAAIGQNDARNLINGKEARSGEFPEVVYISTPGGRCTATVVGPRVIVTAAHCGENNEQATFQVGQTVFKAKLTRSPIYQEGNPDKDHDIALGLIDKDVTGIKFASIGGAATVGSDITLAGYGCTQVGGSGGNDGILRYNDSTIRSHTGFDMESSKQGGGALCFGDSGGPAFVKLSNPVAEHHFLLGVNSKGNIRDRNWNCRTDTRESRDFLENFAQQNSVKICGINQDCSGGAPNPSPSPTPGPEPTNTPQPGTCLAQVRDADGARKMINQRVSELKACMQSLDLQGLSYIE